jgi:hypothetical protein
MNAVIAGVKAFGAFWYHFIIGDDPAIAATVAASLVLTWILATVGFAAWWLPPLAAAIVVGTSVRRVSRR